MATARTSPTKTSAGESQEKPAAVFAVPPSSSDADVVYIPSYSRWFSWNGIHECEVRCLPEFFDNRSPSKNPRAYKYYRNSIVKLFRENPSRKITFTDARRTLVGDVGSVRRVFEFLENWGLINYSTPALTKPFKGDEKDASKSAAADAGTAAPLEPSLPKKDAAKRVCSGCKSVCSIACFACDKYDLTLCARCYVRGNYRVGVSSSDFRRVEISEETKADWTEKETLNLLEAIMHYGDDWKKVAQHVNGRSEKECVAQFLKLPFGEEYLGSAEAETKHRQSKDDSFVEPLSKRVRLTPLADTSNPIMAQAAFLSALTGVEIAEAAAQAAVAALSESGYKATKESLGPHARYTKKQEADVPSATDATVKALEGSYVDASLQLEKEQLDLERAIVEMVEVQMRETQDKIAGFEEMDLQLEKEWQQLENMKDLLFIDQLTLLFHKSSAQNAGERNGQNIRTV